jgi:hypothetical protein
MPWLHKWLGNPVLSWLGRRLFGLRHVRDFHCGIRGFNRESIQALGLCMPGMEFASELVVRAALADYEITEVPTTLAPDGRSRPPHLRTWRDGWRHLRFLLVFAPQKALIAPGAMTLALGLLGTLALAFGPVKIGDVQFDLNTMIYCCIAILVGAQLVILGGFAEIYGRHERIVRHIRLARWAKILRLETCATVGLVLVLLGVVGAVGAFTRWGGVGFGHLDTGRTTTRLVLPSATAIAVGVLFVFSGLLGSLMTLRGIASPPAPAVVVVPPQRRPSEDLRDDEESLDLVLANTDLPDGEPPD